jgi:sugar lactone lactonase YvrE
MESRPTLLLGDLAFPEGPRWHDGRLWLSDMAAKTVLTASPDGGREVVVSINDRPSGLGFLPDGTPLVVSMTQKKVLRLSHGRAEVHADLGDFPGDLLNDMVVDGEGRAYVGTRVASLRPWSVLPEDGDGPDSLVVVHPDGDVAMAAAQMVSPNGTVIAPDGRTLVVAETYAHRLIAFDRGPDGGLSNRRLFAEIDGAYPDGICLDDEGAVWFGSPYSHEFIRVREGGEVTDRMPLAGAVACALGSEGRQRLFLVCVDPAALPAPSATGEGLGQLSGWSGGLHDGCVWTLTVPHGGAGWP